MVVRGSAWRAAIWTSRRSTLTPGERRELADDDRVYLGAWTRLVLRRATPQEQAGSA